MPLPKKTQLNKIVAVLFICEMILTGVTQFFGARNVILVDRSNAGVNQGNASKLSASPIINNILGQAPIGRKNPFLAIDGKQGNQQTAENKDSAVQDKNQSQATIADNQNEAEKQKIRAYLIATSNINFPNDDLKLQSALMAADKGNFEELDKLLGEYSDKLTAYAKIIPPDSLQVIHRNSLEVVENFVKILQSIRDKKGTVSEIWNSEEKTKIQNSAAAVNQKIRKIVEDYQIELPEGVLP